MTEEDQRAFAMMQNATKDPFMEFIDNFRKEEEDFQRRMPHLIKNKEKNFVQRILNPKLNKGKEVFDEEGRSMSHLMTSAGNRVIPMVVDKGGKKLHRFEDDPLTIPEHKRKSAFDKAWEYADKTGEYIETDTEEEATWLGENYKTEEFKRGY